MTLQLIFLYCLCDELLKSSTLKYDPQSRMTYSEVMTFAIAAALYFQGNFSRTRIFSRSTESGSKQPLVGLEVICQNESTQLQKMDFI
jgi:hypothetical protein